MSQQVSPAGEIYRYGLGRARFAQGNYRDALADLRQVTGETEPLRSDNFRSKLVFRLAGSQQGVPSYVRTWPAYDVLRTWLVEQETRARGRGDRAGMADAQAALLWLVRDHYWRWRGCEHAPPNGGGAAGSDRGDEPLEPVSGAARFEDHVMARLVLRADTNLFPEGEATPALRRWASKDLPGLQDQIRQQVGVTVPAGLVILAGEARSAGAYEVHVDGQWVGAGRVRPDGRDRPDAERQDPHAVIFEHLRAIVWSHLDAFVRSQEVADLIQDWRADNPSVELAPAAVHADPRPRLVELIRALLQERVPVLKLDVICERFADADRRRLGLDELVRYVRQGLLDMLPGNQPEWRLLGLSPEFEDAVAINTVGPKGVLALPAKEADRLRTAIGAALDGAPRGRTALVVGRPELRLMLRRLVQADRPDLDVLAVDELAEDRGPVRPVVRVHGRGRAASRRGER
jgi:FHIPEP family